MTKPEDRFDIFDDGKNQSHFDCDCCSFQTNSIRSADRHMEQTGHPVNERNANEEFR